MVNQIGKFELEYDGSIVIKGVIVGKLEPDGLTREEINELNEEIVRRWNLLERGRDD